MFGKSLKAYKNNAACLPNMKQDVAGNGLQYVQKQLSEKKVLSQDLRFKFLCLTCTTTNSTHLTLKDHIEQLIAGQAFCLSLFPPLLVVPAVVRQTICWGGHVTTLVVDSRTL